MRVPQVCFSSLNAGHADLRRPGSIGLTRKRRVQHAAVRPKIRYYQNHNHERFKVLFFGRDEFSCGVLEQLRQAHDVWRELSVVTQPDARVGRRGSKLSISPLKVLAEQMNLPVHSIPLNKDGFKTWQLPLPFGDVAAAPFASHLLVTASFGRILPTSMLDHFLPSRRLNVHPSLLPAYRGASPIQYALLDGLEETGVCIIEMMERRKGIDAGVIWGRERMDIPKDITFPGLRDSLARAGGKLLVSVLRDMLAGKAISDPQPTYPSAPRAPVIKAEDAMVDFETMSAEQIVRRWRAIAHQKPITTVLKSRRTLQLHRPAVYGEVSDDVRAMLPVAGAGIYHPQCTSLLVRCASDTILSVPEVKQQDRAQLTVKEWWNGVRPELRLQVGSEGPVQFLPASAMQV